jgi:O-antigen ligase
MLLNGEPARRPGGVARLSALIATGIGFFAVFSLGFPPAARDRLPILLAALALGLLAAWNPARGLTAFSFLFPLSGLGDRAFGGADAIAWPVLLFAGFAAGWTFRFLYDFENTPDPSRVDGALRALSAVWVLATLLAIVRARTLWAMLHGLGLRAVNVEGLLDSAAIRDSVLSLSALACGVGFFFILRRAGAPARLRAIQAALAGCGLSGAAAVAERLGMPPGETSAFWKASGRLSGGAIDPNALGMLSSLALVAAAAWLLGGGRGGGTARARPLLLAAGAAAGLVLSGSRSGLLVVAVGFLALLFAPGLPGARRLALALAGAAGILVLGLLLSGDKGSLGARIRTFMDPALASEQRASSRPVLWAGAVRLFEKNPVAGAGLGAFAWQLPNLMAERGRALPLRDNPGNAYLQALAESGALGFLLTAAFAVLLAREAAAALPAWKERPLAAGCGAAALGFLAALLLGSHWYAPDVSLAFFLFAAFVARRPAEAAPGRLAPRLTRAAVLVYAAAAVVVGLATLSTDEVFRYRRGIGFHGKEQGAGGAYYWTQRRFAIFLKPGETIRMDLAHYTPEGRPVELTAQADGKVVFEKTFQPGQGVALKLEAPAARARVVRFALSRAFVPRRLGLSADRRELGLVAVFPGR